MTMPELTIQAPDGGSFSSYLALPAKTPAPAILVIQEIFGVNQVMRDTCDWLAREGYVACCPDIFWRIEPGIDITDKTDEEWKRAFELFQAFDVDKGIEDLKATLTALRSHDASTGKVGSVGYCLGGKLAYLMATRSDVDASVGYYGVGLDELMGEAGKISKPLMLHIPTEDGFVPKEAQAKVHATLDDNPQVTLHDYQGNDHAFAREGGQHYDPKAAEQANRRSLDFFKQHLS
ncbi:dienelactone hydrolase family protein [Aquibaculum arenosum]|uniref:Dienelactone hydrolase family protein n=1 Tax=Aquibaculum arenosum TaxID=3032591 RepID=A0ABT5YKV9_9PROT|nr:dienelactone hydrolase family protein [Fodinicurvata sp. CAU 1616]MDF2095586.1 dienelactone hydrolase family protein [Fodinicurvata sp. CAU 1616]